MLYSHALAGLEHDIRQDDSPYIVKSPWFCDYAEDVLKNRKDIQIERVFIPVRNLLAAAESRRFVAQNAKSELTQAEWDIIEASGRPIPGGLWHTKNENQLEIILLAQIYKLALALADSAVPVTLMHYPRIVKDSNYLYTKLKPILGSTSLNQFESVFNKVVRPEFVHSLNENDY